MMPATISIAELRGCLPVPKRAVTLAEMDDAIATGASREVSRRKR